MEFTTALVMLLSGFGLTSMLVCTGAMAKAEGELDIVNLFLGVSSALMAFFGIQSGLKADYAVSIAIIGLLFLLYATCEAHDDLHKAKAKFVSRH